MKYARIDLHLHLDGSLYLPWAYQRAVEEGVVKPDCTFEEYYKEMYKDKFASFEEGIAHFDFPCAVMQTKEDLKMAVWHLIRILNMQGLYYAEIRYAPQLHCKKGLTQREVQQAILQGVHQAKADFPDIEIGIINCMMHKGDSALVNEKENLETVEITREALGKGVVGLDLAGFENTGDFMLYKPLFEKAKEYQIPYTIHAGEMGIGDHIPMAIEMGAHRIGHGIHAVLNPDWLKQVVETQIPLEVCVTSNQVNRLYASHPIHELLKAGAYVTINTDNMMFSRTSLVQEHNMLYNSGISEETLYHCAMNAIQAAFCNDEIKQKVIAKLQALHNQ